jgi:hypothetical protein
MVLFHTRSDVVRRIRAIVLSADARIGELHQVAGAGSGPRPGVDRALIIPRQHGFGGGVELVGARLLQQRHHHVRVLEKADSGAR